MTAVMILFAFSMSLVIDLFATKFSQDEDGISGQMDEAGSDLKQHMTPVRIWEQLKK